MMGKRRMSSVGMTQSFLISEGWVLFSATADAVTLSYRHITVLFSHLIEELPVQQKKE